MSVSPLNSYTIKDGKHFQGVYPGWKMDLRKYDQENNPTYPMGIHYNCRGSESEPIMVREVAMLMVMDRLSDKPNWHIKIFDDEIADKWKKEALAWPDDDIWSRVSLADAYDPDNEHTKYNPRRPKKLLDQACVDYCIDELRHKAQYFNKTGVIPTLDASFTIAKSDTIVSPDLHANLQEAFSRLRADQASNPDWHPNTNEIVQDLVHPSMYPLVFGRSRFFEDEVVGVQDAIDKWAGKGIVISQWESEKSSTDPSYRSRYDVPEDHWSSVYQWLPANLKFTEEGGVKFTSYINNLHPVKYSDIYKTLEELVEKALPMWDQCLKQCLKQYRNFKVVGPGREKPRIYNYEADDGNPKNWDPETAPPVPAELADTIDENDYWSTIRQPVQTPPPPFSTSEVSYDIRERNTLREQFKSTGLQIIVKMASIELTPEKPEFSTGGWHVEGMMNEHIVGTALYYLDSENITETSLEFRTHTSQHIDMDRPFTVGQSAYYWLQSAYGVMLGGGVGSDCIQNYGNVLTPQGRMLAFPNVFHHRVSGFKLADPTKPGHRRFIALWLVDPFTRIISTANVPPQQAEWWAELAFSRDSNVKMPLEMVQLLTEKGLAKEQLAGSEASASSMHWKLPPELMEMVRKELEEGPLPMTRAEAEEHRLKLMAERTKFHEHHDDQRYGRPAYGFCEH